jgi:Lar family restriction alleviation protein
MNATLDGNDVDAETRLRDAKPCPFCGSTNIWTYPGSTFRWRYAGCGECGAQCGEVRIDTIGIPRPQAVEEANGRLIKEWNQRV